MAGLCTPLPTLRLRPARPCSCSRRGSTRRSLRADCCSCSRPCWQRLFTLQKGWERDWKDWVLSDQIKGANTISKLAEREGNIVAQFVQLLGAQGTDLIGLLENIQVDYSYWVHEKLSENGSLLPLRSSDGSTLGPLGLSTWPQAEIARSSRTPGAETAAPPAFKSRAGRGDADLQKSKCAAHPSNLQCYDASCFRGHVTVTPAVLKRLCGHLVGSCPGY